VYEQKVYKLILKNVVNTQKFFATFTQRSYNSNNELKIKLNKWNSITGHTVQTNN